MCLPDPFKLCKLLCTLFFIAILVVVGGYVGKGIYIQHNNPNESTYSMIRDSSFYIPDFYFWLFGLTFAFLVIAVLAILQLIFDKLSEKTGEALLWLICLPCNCKCNNQQDVSYGLLDV